MSETSVELLAWNEIAPATALSVVEQSLPKPEKDLSAMQRSNHRERRTQEDCEYFRSEEEEEEQEKKKLFFFVFCVPLYIY